MSLTAVSVDAGGLDGEAPALATCEPGAGPPNPEAVAPFRPILRPRHFPSLLPGLGRVFGRVIWLGRGTVILAFFLGTFLPF